jgi:hypothetical protein
MEASFPVTGHPELCDCMKTSGTDDDEGKRVCSGCVGEAFLKQRIHEEGTLAECSYCQSEGATISVEELADHVDRAFEEHFSLTDTEPDGWEYAMMRDPDIDYDWERKGEESIYAIAGAADIDEEIAEDVRGILQGRHSDFDSAAGGMECGFEPDAHYDRISPGEGVLPELWEQFEDGLKTKARFFSRSAHLILDQIFEGIDGLRSAGGGPVVVAAGPGTKFDHLFRARVFQNEMAKLEQALAFPWQDLGTHPSTLAGAGRMNARGISVFYGASDAKTAVKEVRPPVGSMVAVARFNILRGLRLLDLTALKTVDSGGSLFDPATLVAMQKGSFLSLLSHTMSRAVMPHEEASEYLTTQAVADYLASEIGLDGIVFPSVQSGYSGTNVVLFHRSARVAAENLPPGSKVKAGFDVGDPDDPTPGFSVFEEVALPESQADDESNDLPFQIPFVDDRGHIDGMPTTLSVDLESLEVRLIEAVEFAYEPIPVSRYRVNKSHASEEIL